jgi:hypothetical protein
MFEVRYHWLRGAAAEPSLSNNKRSSAAGRDPLAELQEKWDGEVF